MKKYIVFIKHIHSCCASASSTDKWLYKVIPTHENKIKLEVGQSAPYSQLFNNTTTTSLEVITEIDEEDKFITNVYFEADKTFYNLERGRGMAEYHNTPEFKALIKKYVDAGWSAERPTIEDERSERMEKKHYANRKKEGFVLYKKYNQLKPEDYKGGLSTEFFNIPHLQKYINEIPFGYIGHSVRTIHTDRCIEKTLRSLNMPLETLSLYLTSSDGRHFGDSLEGLSPEEQEIRISNYSPHFYHSIIKYSKE